MTQFLLLNPLPHDSMLINQISQGYQQYQSLDSITKRSFQKEQIKNLVSEIKLDGTLTETIEMAKQLKQDILSNIHHPADLNASLNQYLKVLLSILDKQIEICRNVNILLQNNATYGAYSLWRNLYEMDVVSWGLYRSVIEGLNINKMNLIIQRYVDFSFIEEASVNDVGLHLNKRQYIQLTSEQKKLYDKEQEILMKYNGEDPKPNPNNTNKLIKSYDWANPLFLKAELMSMLPPCTPNLYSLVKKSQTDTAFFIVNYSNYNKASGFIHSSYLSTKFNNGESVKKYIAQTTSNIMQDFILRILQIPDTLFKSLLKSKRLPPVPPVKKQQYLCRTYYKIFNKALAN